MFTLLLSYALGYLSFMLFIAMLDKTIERTIRIPRVRMIDCCRLIFRLGKTPEWRDIDSDPDLYPLYPLPSLKRNFYIFGDNKITINQGDGINDIVRKICSCEMISNYDDRFFLHTLIFKKSGELLIKTEII